ncbi:MAG: DUF3108 domain-containing protein [Desulfomonilaceae bacterium]
MSAKYLRIVKRIVLVVFVTFCSLLAGGTRECRGAAYSELLRYEVTWNGSRAGHGDIATKTDSKHVSVIAQAVTDGVVKTLVELWSRVQATFSANTFKPESYNFQLKSSWGQPELVALSFDHRTNLVQINKQKGNERDSHAEKFGRQCDPITAAFMLRHQKDLSKPMFVDIYDGKDRSRLFVNPVGVGNVTVKTGSHPAYCLKLRLVKLGGDGKEIAKGRLWISNDEHRVPLLLTSSPLIGTIRFELVQSQL